jgi:hypothetical protein
MKYIYHYKIRVEFPYKIKIFNAMSKHVKNFNHFLKENVNVEDVTNESEDWYISNGYVTDENINNLEELKSVVADKIQDAMDDFAKKYDFPKTLKIEVSNSHRGGGLSIDAGSDDFEGKDLGVFDKALNRAYLYLFSGRTIEASEKNGKFFFRPSMWSTISLGYESKGGGSNGVNYMYTEVSGRPDNSLYYDILEGKFYNGKDWFEKNK